MRRNNIDKMVNDLEQIDANVFDERIDPCIKQRIQHCCFLLANRSKQGAKCVDNSMNTAWSQNKGREKGILRDGFGRNTGSQVRYKL